MCKELKVRKLPKGFNIRHRYTQYGIAFNREVYNEVYYGHRDLVNEDIGHSHPYGVHNCIEAKLKMLTRVREYLKNEGLEFDEFNSLPPTRLNAYKAYEFAAVWIWAEIVEFTKTGEMPTATWYKKYGPCLASVMRKYPKITGMLISVADLHLPGNKCRGRGGRRR